MQQQRVARCTHMIGHVMGRRANTEQAKYQFQRQPDQAKQGTDHNQSFGQRQPDSRLLPSREPEHEKATDECGNRKHLSQRECLEGARENDTG